MRNAIVLIAALLLLPTVAAASPVTLYFHLDAHQDFPINTQPPDDRYADSSSRGLFNPTTTCIPSVDGVGQVHQAYHTSYGFSTPGYVQYDFEEDGGPRIHPERGIASDVLLDRSAPATLTWFLETQATSNAGDDPTVEILNTAPLVVPQVEVTATVRTGDDVGIGAASYNQGRVIAQGGSGPRILSPTPDNPDHFETDDGRHVHMFVIPLDIQMDHIPAEDAFNVRIDVALDLPICPDDPDESVMLPVVRAHTSPEHRPRIEWSIENPMTIEKVTPRIVDGRLLVDAIVSSPWGNYDVDETDGGITVQIDGPSTPASVQRVQFVQRHHDHGRHVEPVEATFQWPYQNEGATLGEYMIQVTAWNDQRTGTATATATADLAALATTDSDGNVMAAETQEKGAPGLGPVIVVAGLMVAALWRRS